MDIGLKFSTLQGLFAIIATVETKGEKIMQIPPEECTVRNYVIDPHQIHYLRFIVEAYEGLGVVSTVDSAMGHVTISVPPGCESEIDKILQAERDILKLRNIGYEDR
jgi:hypothetical protein